MRAVFPVVFLFLVVGQDTACQAPEAVKYYYLRGPHNWIMLSSHMQEWLHHVDAQVLGWNHGVMTGYDFNVPFMRGFLDRPAKYEIRHVHDNPVPLRLILFGDGERSEVRFADRVPDVHHTDHYSQSYIFK